MRRLVTSSTGRGISSIEVERDGKLRFGSDHRTSVLDRNRRTHEVGNLYVVDGSFSHPAPP